MVQQTHITSLVSFSIFSVQASFRVPKFLLSLILCTGIQGLAFVYCKRFKFKYCHAEDKLKRLDYKSKLCYPTMVCSGPNKGWGYKPQKQVRGSRSHGVRSQLYEYHNNKLLCASKFELKTLKIVSGGPCGSIWIRSCSS